MTGAAGDELSAWGERLGREWDERAASEHCRFFVASCAGGEGFELSWKRQAAVDADLVTLGIPRPVLARQHVLEIGCGIGRLASELAGRVASYSGFDVSGRMVQEAVHALAGTTNCRFAVGDGARVPPELRDRDYDLVFALAVFIHCPRPIIASLIRDAYALLAPGGRLRLQVLGDAADPTGIVSLETAAAIHEQAKVVAAAPIDRRLIDDRYYKGEEFGYEELRGFLTSLVPGPVRLLRADLLHIYAEVRRPPVDYGSETLLSETSGAAAGDLPGTTEPGSTPGTAIG